MSYSEYWEQIYSRSEKMNVLISSYWREYSGLGTWQFWAVLALMVLPLVIVYLSVDRTRIFEIFFFGYTVHILWTYADSFLERYSYFVHTYFLLPMFPYAMNMTASALPVGFLLIYQYCTNRNKSFLLYTILASAVFAFVFATVEEWAGMVHFNKGMNQFYIFLIDIAIAYAAYFLTMFVKRMSDNIKG
ncbi:hypothetical protein [Cytobacillus oceanisediminis]|jgi:hypothetical protein|uniref:hypothetical protein n=1 Tax=Cytobacillus oceanisediminis TaxID=665099 RepID=UPI001C2116CC|nr:hypothetical protein [Cytobacillus oceanisediminis]MBU8769699.1 hypothetical protein [Cytobacillus oceanisediminis]MCM3394542.1 hypothetical protein [Cytobacillus oceanisediminis]